MTLAPGTFKHKADCTRPDLQVTVNATGTRRNCPKCGRWVFTHADAPLSPLTTAQARHLAAELIRELTPHAGDPDAVRATLTRWLDVEDVARLSLICMAVVQTTFGACLSRVPLDQMPPGALALTPNGGTQ